MGRFLGKLLLSRIEALFTMTNNEQWVDVKLIGELGKRFGRNHRFFVRHPRDIISALSRQIDGFKDYLSTAHENGVAFRLITDDPRGIGYEHLELSCQRLVIAPVIAGAGGKGFSDRKSTRLNSSHVSESRMPSSA